MAAWMVLTSDHKLALLKLWFTFRYHPQVFMFPDTRHVQGHNWSFGSRLDTILKCSCFQTLGRHVQGHYWSFGSRLDTILKCSCFQTLGMFNGTTETLVHVSMPSSSVHVSRHYACSRNINLSGCLSRLGFSPRTTMFTLKQTNGESDDNSMNSH